MEVLLENRCGRSDRWSVRVTTYISAIAGILYALSIYSRFGFAWSWLALAAFVFSVRQSETYAQCRRSGLVFGLFFFGVQFDCLRTTGLAGDWFGFGQFTISWMALVLGGALIWQFISIAIRWFWTERGYPCCFALPVAVLTAEFLVDYFARFVLNTTGGACQLAVRQVDCPWLLQAAAVGGSTAVSWLTATLIGLSFDVFFCLVSWSDRPHRRHRIIVIIPLLFVVGFCVWRLQDQGPTVTVSGPRILIVPDTFSAGDEHSGRNGLVRLARSAPPVELAIWPELAIPTSIAAQTTANDPLDDMVSSLECSILVGAPRIDPNQNGPCNSAVYVTWPNHQRSFYDKRFLTPGFEGRQSLTPFQSWFVPAENSFAEPSMYLAGTRPTKTFLVPTRPKSENISVAVTFGVGICHDICFPEWGMEWMQMKEPPDFLVQIANESADWTWRVQPLLLGMARLRAVETQRTVVRCVRNGLSGVIGPDGRLLQFSDRNHHQRPFVTAPIPIVRWIGLGTRIGHLPCLMIELSLTGILGCVLRHRRPKSESESATGRIS